MDFWKRSGEYLPTDERDGDRDEDGGDVGGVESAS